MSEDLIGTRVGAVTKIGGWATHVLIAADTLVPVPPALDPALVEAVLVNGVTAWQILYPKARVKPGQTPLVHGANGGRGSIPNPTAPHCRIPASGTPAPSPHDTLRG